jgi:hypothetical protein
VGRKKRTVTETETHRVLMMHGLTRQAFCAGCQRQVEMFTLDRAAELANLTAFSLRDHLPEGGGHVVETGGTLWVCAEWLSRLR